jgi:hypothetical protein
VITYRVSVDVPANVLVEWLSWMTSKHIPDVLSTGCFVGFSIHKVVDPNPDAATVVIDYFAACMDAYNRYSIEFAPALQAHHTQRYGALVSASRQLLTNNISG